MINFTEVLDRAVKIEGWMRPHAGALLHALLSQQAATARNILEIGVFKGKSATVLAYEAALRDETLVLIDAYIQPETAALSQLHSKIELVKSDSFNLLNIGAVQAAAPFRFIHIDGNHNYSYVMDDIKNCAKLVARNGIICLDDFLTPAWPEVTVAIFDFLAARENDLVLFLAGFNKGFVCRSTALQSYCELIENKLGVAMKDLGWPITIHKRRQNHPFCFYGLYPAN